MMDDRHVLYVEWIAAIAERQGVPLHVVRDVDGGATDHLELELEHASASVFVVVPYPPVTWQLNKRRLPLAWCSNPEPHRPHDHSPAASRHCPGIERSSSDRTTGA